MASHRRTKVPVRTVMTLSTTTAAAAVGVVLNAPPSQAATVAQIEAQVSQLNQQSEQAADQYDADQEQLAELNQRIDDLQSQAAQAQAALSAIQNALGPVAAAQYQNGAVSPTLELLLSSHPDTFLAQASAQSQANESAALTVHLLQQQQAALKAIQAQASADYQMQTQLAAGAQTLKQQYLGEYEQAQSLLSELTYQEQMVFDYSPVTQSEIDGLPKVTGRVAVAIAFAQSKIGMPYQWGGTGDPSFDCSGLVQAAWGAAGISLPRTTWEQVDVGIAVPALLADLEPGDVIFYYNDDHEALYVGNGLIIQAPQTGYEHRLCELGLDAHIAHPPRGHVTWPTAPDSPSRRLRRTAVRPPGITGAAGGGCALRERRLPRSGALRIVSNLGPHTEPRWTGPRFRWHAH